MKIAIGKDKSNNKEYLNMTKSKLINRTNFILYIKDFFVICFPMLLCAIVVFGDNWNQYGMWNDNQRQWIHIMDTSLNSFFHGKGMPFYNFYNYKGIEIYGQGYYGLYNPLIWLSWLVGKIIHVKTMTMYIYICGFLGNLAVNLIAKKLKCTWYNTAFMIIAYMFTPIIYNGGNWYYIWMNYWIIPMLIYSILLWNSMNIWKNILFTSAILLASILSGNSQYTVMHYIIYGICGCFICVIKRYKKFFMNLLCSILFSIMLGLPFLYDLLKASTRSLVFGENTDFLSSPFHPFKYLCLNIIPNRIKGLRDLLNSLIIRNENIDYYDSYNTEYLFIGALVFGTILFLCYLLHKKLDKNRKLSFEDVVGISCVIMWLFWLMYIGGKHFYVAEIFSHLPIINRFRYLYKAIFVMPPLLIIPVGIGLNCIVKFGKWKKILVYFLFLVAGIEQLIECAEAVQNSYPDYNYSYLSDIQDYDRENYRTIFITSDEDNHEFINGVPYANANVSAGIQTVGGFDLTCGKLTESMLELYAEIEWVGLTGSNAVCVGDLQEYIDKNEDGIGKFINALKENSVGYIMTQNSNLNSFLENVNENGVKTKSIYYNMKNGVEIFQLKDIPAIARSKSGCKINIENMQMDSMDIVIPNNCGPILLDERYNENLCGYFLEENSDRKTEVELYPYNEKISIIPPNRKGTIHIVYKNPVESICVFLTVIYMIFILLEIVIGIRDEGCHDDKRNII